LIMKSLIIALFLVGSVLSCFQADGKRFILEEVKKERANNQLIPDAQPGEKSVNNGATDSKPIDKPGKSGTEANPVKGSVPAVDKNAAGNNNNKESDNNDNYGSYGNPSGSSTETHHVFTDDNRPGPH
ncbi:unnamed protein product, partial [Ilex paraguariensis]